MSAPVPAPCASPLAPRRAGAALLLAAAAAAGSSCGVVGRVDGGGDAGDSLTRIPAIQGPGAASPLAGRTVTTRGVVTRVNNNGYSLQDAAGDGDPATSDGIFVFTGTAPTVSAGQVVQVTGRVTEFNTGAATNPATLANTVTELTAVSAQAVLGAGAVVPTPVALPEPAPGALERVEGMLVRIDQPLTVSQNHFLGRFGQLTLSAGGRLETPTNRHRPGTPQARALADANARSSLLLDDGTSVQNPHPIPYIGPDDTVRGGDTLAGLVGVLDFGLAGASNAGVAGWRIHPTETPVFVRSHPRTSAPPSVGGNVKVASFNVLNYFTTLADGTRGCLPRNVPADCRGAGNAAELERQRSKTVAALAAIDADAVGLVEIENNGNAAVQDLVDALNARVGAGTYAAVPLPAGGTGTDAIRVAMIHKPGRLAAIGAPRSHADPVHHRPPLAQTFAAANGERFTLVVNHFKSKHCEGATGADADAGDGQGCFNALRLRQGAALRRFAGELQAAAGDPDVLLVGDLNAYAQEDPVVAFVDAGWVDLIARFDAFGYSFVFDGAAGRLDHALATASASAQVTGAAEWHINADEPAVLDYNLEFKPQDLFTPTPYRSADHDPVVIGLSLGT